MHWAVAAPFFSDTQDNPWLHRHVPGQRHSFTTIVPPAGSDQVVNRAANTTPQGWRYMWRHAGNIFAAKPEGIVTLFPQLPAVCGLRKRLTFKRTPIVAWCFNMGMLYGSAKQKIARFGLSAVDRFICHSSAEVDQYSQWLGLPRERFRFVELQIAEIPITEREEANEPFILSMGSARRDYGTFFKAVETIGLPTVVVAAPYAVEGLKVPANVKVMSGLSREACQALAQRARVNVVPIKNDQTASGQVTVIEAMRMRRAVIATHCLGTRDYVKNEETGLLVEGDSVDALAASIRRVWEDGALRNRLGQAAGDWAETHLSDAAAGRSLGKILDEVADEYGKR